MTAWYRSGFTLSGVSRRQSCCCTRNRSRMYADGICRADMLQHDQNERNDLGAPGLVDFARPGSGREAHSFEGWGRHFKLHLRFRQSLSFKLRTHPKLASCTVVIRPSRATTPNDPWLESCWSLDTLE